MTPGETFAQKTTDVHVLIRVDIKSGKLLEDILYLSEFGLKEKFAIGLCGISNYVVGLPNTAIPWSNDFFFLKTFTNLNHLMVLSQFVSNFSVHEFRLESFIGIHGSWLLTWHTQLKVKSLELMCWLRGWSNCYPEHLLL